MQEAVPFSQAIARKYPEQVVLAIARDPQGKCNPIALGWTMITSGKPPMMAISVGLGRYSLEAIRHAGAFVISFPSASMEQEMLYYGSVSGRDHDKLAERPTPTQPATVIDGVILGDAVANFECVLEGELLTGDHVIFAGRIVAAHANSDPSVVRLYNLGGSRFTGLPASVAR